jgi:hypothetical protein
MTDSQQNPHKLTLGHLLANVSRLVGARTRMKLQEFGLYHAQGMILFHLWRKDGMAQNVLAQALNITPPTATNTLQRMERNGWIRRRRDETDQRAAPRGAQHVSGVGSGTDGGTERKRTRRSCGVAFKGPPASVTEDEP